MRRLDLDNIESDKKGIKIIEKIIIDSSLSCYKGCCLKAVYVSDSYENVFVNATIQRSYRKMIPGTKSKKGHFENEYLLEEVFLTLYFPSDPEISFSGVMDNKTSFTPIKDSNMLGLMKTQVPKIENGVVVGTEEQFKLTFGYGSHVKRSEPLDFNSQGIALVTFKWEPQLFLPPSGENILLGCEQTPIYFDFLVDKAGNIRGPIYDSITGEAVETNTCSFNFGNYERDFVLRALNQSEIIKSRREVAKADLFKKVYTLSNNSDGRE
jgi:hypothetical protein